VSPRSLALDERLYAYYRAVGLREHPALAALREATDALPEGSARSSAEQAQLLAFLVELTGAERVLEVGCFTGYGTLAMALALPEQGRLPPSTRTTAGPPSAAPSGSGPASPTASTSGLA
jgi:predicted O-methyltransferase YrrM